MTYEYNPTLATELDELGKVDEEQESDRWRARAEEAEREIAAKDAEIAELVEALVATNSVIEGEPVHSLTCAFLGDWPVCTCGAMQVHAVLSRPSSQRALERVKATQAKAELDDGYWWCGGCRQLPLDTGHGPDDRDNFCAYCGAKIDWRSLDAIEAGKPGDGKEPK